MSKSQDKVSEAFQYLADNETRFVRELQEFLRFPSISAQSIHDTDVRQCARWLQKHLANIGLETRLIETSGHPIVWALAKSHNSKRLIIYGHYDVQPEDPLEQWHSNPFSPTIHEGFIYARGAKDDKGPLLAHVKGLESLMKTGNQPPCEVLFLIEGEEESGGTSMSEYIKSYKSELTADAIVISDTSMYAEGIPAITYGLRGLIAIEVTVTTAKYDLHSGLFGGAIANPCTVLTQIVSRCVGADGKITIPGLYDKVKPMEEWEKRNIKKLEYNDDELKTTTGSEYLIGEAGFSTLERLWARPSFDVNGIVGGYTDKGMKTIIPAKATAKMSIRLVPDQEPKEVIDLIKKHIFSICPNYAKVEVHGPLTSAKPVLFDVNHPYIKAGWEAVRQGFDAEPVFIRAGSSIPVVNTFCETLGKPIILMGFGLASDGAHSPNERFKIANFINGAKASAYLQASI